MILLAVYAVVAFMSWPVVRQTGYAYWLLIAALLFPPAWLLLVGFILLAATKKKAPLPPIPTATRCLSQKERREQQIV